MAVSPAEYDEGRARTGEERRRYYRLTAFGREAVRLEAVRLAIVGWRAGPFHDGGAAIDLPLTDTPVWDVYLRRGPILDPDAPWTDDATGGILGQYIITHYVAAQTHALRSGGAAAEDHLGRASWWQSVGEG